MHKSALLRMIKTHGEENAVKVFEAVMPAMSPDGLYQMMRALQNTVLKMKPEVDQCKTKLLNQQDQKTNRNSQGSNLPNAVDENKKKYAEWLPPNTILPRQ